MTRDFLLGPTVNARPMHAIAAEVCEARGVSPVDFFSKRRKRPYVLARQEFCWRARNETFASYPKIGQFLDRDHTTIMDAVKKHEERMKSSAGVPDSV